MYLSSTVSDNITVQPDHTQESTERSEFKKFLLKEAQIVVKKVEMGLLNIHWFLVPRGSLLSIETELHAPAISITYCMSFP